MHATYLRMIKKIPMGGERCWSVYMLRCGDGSLYTGITKDVERRLLSHQSGRGAAYTKTHSPVALVYREKGFTRSQALIREAEIKRYSKPKKEKLINLC